MRGPGAVAVLTRDGGQVTAVELLEGVEAEAVVRPLGFPASSEVRRRVPEAFRAGWPLDEAAAAAFRQPVAQLPPRDGCHWYWSPEGALVEVRAEDGLVSSVQLLTRGAALDLLRAAAGDRNQEPPRQVTTSPLYVRCPRSASAPGVAKDRLRPV